MLVPHFHGRCSNTTTHSVPVWETGDGQTDLHLCVDDPPWFQDRPPVIHLSVQPGGSHDDDIGIHKIRQHSVNLRKRL